MAPLNRLKLLLLTMRTDVHMRIETLVSRWDHAYNTWYWRKTYIEHWRIEILLREDKTSEKTGYVIT